MVCDPKRRRLDNTGTFLTALYLCSYVVQGGFDTEAMDVLQVLPIDLNLWG